MGREAGAALDNETRAALGLRLTVVARDGAPAETAAHLLHVADRAGLLYDERLGEALARHAQDRERRPSTFAGRLAVPREVPAPEAPGATPNERRADHAEAVMAAAGDVAETVTEGLRNLAHLADWLGEDPARALGADAVAAYRVHLAEGPRCARDRARHPSADPVLLALARRATELEGVIDRLPGEPLPPRPWRPPGPPSEQRFWWPAGDGVRETATLHHGHLVAAGRDRCTADGRLLESWELASVRHWTRERYAHDRAGRVVRVERLESVVEAEHPQASVWLVRWDEGGRVEPARETNCLG